MKYLKRFYYIMLSYMFGYGSFFYYYAKLEDSTKAILPGHHHWTDDYFLWCQYIRQKSFGKNKTLKEIRGEYFKQWEENFKKAREILDKRNMGGML